MDLKKIVLPVILVVVVAAYIAYEHFYGRQSTQAPVINNNGNQSSDQTSSNNQNNQQNPPAQSGYTDGTYTGDVANAFYGNIQVQVTIGSGKITDVQLLSYPDHAGHTQEVSSMSLPTLKSEVIQSQSAQVDVVSGATQTSQAFMQSVASALVKAGAQNQPNIQVTPPKMSM